MGSSSDRSEEHTSELQSRQYLVCRLLLEKKLTAWPRGRAVGTWTLRPGTSAFRPVAASKSRTRTYANSAQGTHLTSTGVAAFFFNDTATTEIYTLSLHDALPI